MELTAATVASTTDKVSFEGHSITISVIVVLLACIVIFIGIPSNIALIFAVALSPKIRNLNNFIVANISFSGLVQLVTVIPWQLPSIISGTWPFKPWFCKGTFLISFITVDALVNNMAILAIYRYFVVVRRRNYFLRKKRVVMTMVFIGWLIAITIPSVLMLVFFETSFIPEYGRCTQDQNDIKTAILYKFMTAAGILKGFVPLLFAYVRIFWEVRKHSMAVKSEGFDSQPSGRLGSQSHAQARGTNSGGQDISRPRLLTQREVTITFICALNFLLFIICYGPIIIATAIFDGKGEGVPGDLQKMCTLMYWIGNTLNPVSYAIIHKDTRTALFAFIRKTLCRRSPGR
ncbi:Beta-1 adrenergic receptor [Holothuria leucospilota]|uniref:Beta-1 adrenergic receptor n=1 Tax=Holothuria leucospilota TaxID=206669 RepID=A0A9Q0YLE9_HOLLE|nr:Beta-1 adrenergic receptor [Holothuria leucospilota]